MPHATSPKPKRKSYQHHFFKKINSSRHIIVINNNTFVANPDHECMPITVIRPCDRRGEAVSTGSIAI